MKQYIIDNIAPLAIGVSIGLAVAITLSTIDSVVTKIALIIKKEQKP